MPRNPEYSASMAESGQELLRLLHQLAEGCRASPDARHWAEWFERDRAELQSAPETNHAANVLHILADLRRALWGGMGAFCDGGAPTRELEKLGHAIYRLATRIEAALKAVQARVPSVEPQSPQSSRRE